MKPVRCPHFDALTHNLVDAYARLGDSDVLCVLGGMEVSSEIDRVHLQMAEHRRTCPLCSQIDHERPTDQNTILRALKQRAQSDHKSSES